MHHFQRTNRTPLLAACAGGHSETAHMLINSGANVDVSDAYVSCWAKTTSNARIANAAIQESCFLTSLLYSMGL